MVDLENLENLNLRENLDDFSVEDFNQMVAYIKANDDVIKNQDNEISKLKEDIIQVKATNMMLAKRGIKEEVKKPIETMLFENFIKGGT